MGMGPDRTMESYSTEDEEDDDGVWIVGLWVGCLCSEFRWLSSEEGKTESFLETVVLGKSWDCWGASSTQKLEMRMKCL